MSLSQNADKLVTGGYWEVFKNLKAMKPRQQETVLNRNEPHTPYGCLLLCLSRLCK